MKELNYLIIDVVVNKSFQSRSKVIEYNSILDFLESQFEYYNLFVYN